MNKETDFKKYTDYPDGIIMLSLVMEKQFRRLVQEGNLNSYLIKRAPYTKEKTD
jgi:hypothetical protein